MKKFVILGYAFFLLMAAGGQKLYSATLHAILVGDCASVDVRAASLVDLNNFENELYHIAMNCNLKLDLKVIAESKKMTKKVFSTLKNLNPKRNDIVFFYFSGHGFRTSDNGESPWPNIDFPVENRGVRFKSIIDIIYKKNAALSIVFADCCSRLFNSHNAPPVLKGPEMSFEFTKTQKRNMRQLFCKSKGQIAIVSSARDQAAYCTTLGSFYSLSFLHGLRQVTSEEECANWQAVLERAKELLQPLLEPHNVQQDPFVIVNIK